MTGVLHLVRHGETTANVERLLDTRPPGAPLTPTGQDQAREFAASRPEAAPVALISSVARRAQQTARAMGQVWDVPYRVLDGLHEIQVGECEGRNDEDAFDTFRVVSQQWQEGERDARIPGGESLGELLDRYLPTVTMVRETYLDDGDVYVVSHGAAIRLVTLHLVTVDPEFARTAKLDNTGSIDLAPTDDGWQLLSWAGLDPANSDPLG